MNYPKSLELTYLKWAQGIKIFDLKISMLKTSENILKNLLINELNRIKYANCKFL